VYIQPPHASSVNQKNTVINKIPSATGIRAGGGSSGGSGSSPIVLQNHLYINEREIASIVSNVTAKVGNNCERDFRWVVSR
jgi:hypothetical protein